MSSRGRPGGRPLHWGGTRVPTLRSECGARRFCPSACCVVGPWSPVGPPSGPSVHWEAGLKVLLLLTAVPSPFLLGFALWTWGLSCWAQLLPDATPAVAVAPSVPVLLLFKGENNTNPFLPSLLVIRISRVLNENVDFTLGASF